MKKFKFALLVLGFLLLTGGMAMAGGGSQAASSGGGMPTGTYTWIAGGMGGGWYTVAGGFARLLNEKEPRITINVIPGGGVGNPVALDQGEAEIAWGVGYVDRAAWNGNAALFKQKYTNMASVAGTLSVDYYHFLAAADQGITTIDQLAQKIKSGEKVRLAAPPNGTSDYVMAAIILDFYGVTFDMIEKNGGSLTQAVYADIPNMFKDRHVDYSIACLGMPGAIMTEMAIGRPSVILAASNELVDHCHNTYGTVARTTGLTKIPGGTYPGIPNDAQAVCHSTEILVSPKLNEDVVYTFTKVLNENKDFLVQLAASYAVFDPKTTAATSVQVPLHPGAARYYKEVGILK